MHFEIENVKVFSRKENSIKYVYILKYVQQYCVNLVQKRGVLRLITFTYTTLYKIKNLPFKD